MKNKYEGFIFDLDGTIYLEDEIIPGALECVNELKKMGKKLAFMSNKTTGSAGDYFRFLKAKGFNVSQEEIINSTIVTKSYLKRHFPGEFFYAIGEDAFINELEASGLHFTEDPALIKVVLITLDRSLNYKKLEIAACALERGARFFAANTDYTCPVEGGEILDAGSTICALEKRTGLRLEKNFGKPSKYMLAEIKKCLSCQIERCLLVGDRLETDIAMGNRFGLDTAWVATGVKYKKSPVHQPTYRIDSVVDILNRKIY